MTKRTIGKPYSFQKRLRLYWRDQFTCTYCHRPMHPLSEDLTLDHVDPQGGDDDTNLVTSCRSCNSRKGNKTAFPPPITQEAILAALGKAVGVVGLGKISLSDAQRVINDVAVHWGVPPEALLSASRQSLLVRARAELAHKLRDGGLTLQEIALLLGKKDHSTILHMLKTHSPNPDKNREQLIPRL